MTKRITYILILLSIFFSATAFVVNNDKLFEITKNIEIFTTLYKELNHHYVDDLDPDKLMKTGIDAMLESLDPYTRYYSENQIERYRFLTEGKYEGIGAQVGKVDDYITILEPYEGFAAFKAGIKAGDRIVSVAGEPTKGKSLEEVRAMLRGVAGTELYLGIQSYGSNKDREVMISRSEVNVDNVPYHGMIDDKIGYVLLTTFTPKAGKNIAMALRELKEDNPEMEGFVLDLRNNGGGLLREAINICNIFIPKGEEIVMTKGKIVERDRPFKTMNTPVDLDLPLVVMINKRSASASEIVSGVIQDLDRGVIMGQRSFGKGLVQNTLKLGYNNNLKLTTAKYYIPSGRCIQSVKYDKGEPVDIPDDERAVFYTKNGRRVLDGGGVTPDINISIDDKPEVLKALLEQFVIFNYVNEFALKNDSIDLPGSFSFVNYDEFKEFVKSKNFAYESSTEKELSDLKSKVAEDQEEINRTIAQMETMLAETKVNELETHSAEIVREIEREIISRYYYQNGKAKQHLNSDSELKEAIAILKDQDQYKKILKQG
jgi:carboxyl-terminal processing protease